MQKRHVFCEDQRFSFELKNVRLEGVIVDKVGKNKSCPYGIVGKKTKMSIHTPIGTRLKVSGAAETKPIWNLDLDDLKLRLKDLGVGGMTDIANQILVRGFSNRLEPGSEEHEKGFILYGPPGSGKTFLATKLCHLLDTVKPKIVKGPELNSMWHGKTEEHIRNLFTEAIEDHKQYGSKSKLHVIIIDEIDSMTASRDSGFGTGNSSIHQLLTMLQGPGSTDNICIIGTTNRLDLIDKALLRNGRLGLHFKVDNPIKPNRLEMLNVILKKMKDNRLLHSDVDIDELAELTDGFASSSLAALATAAKSVAFERNGHSRSDIMYTMQDFKTALDGIKETGKASAEERQVHEKIGMNENMIDRLKILERNAVNAELKTQMETNHDEAIRRIDQMEERQKQSHEVGLERLSVLEKRESKVIGCMDEMEKQHQSHEEVLKRLSALEKRESQVIGRMDEMEKQHQSHEEVLERLSALEKRESQAIGRMDEMESQQQSHEVLERLKAMEAKLELLGLGGKSTSNV